MITYSAQFPVNEKLDKKTFVNLVIDWNQGSKYDKFNQIDWDGETFSKQWIEGEKQLSIEEVAARGVIASQFRKEDEHGLWKTDFILNYDKKYITVRVALETTDYTTDFYPAYYPPFFVKKLIYRGYSGNDVNIPVKQKAYSLDDYKDVLTCLSDNKGEYSMPIVFISKKDNGMFPVELSTLAFELQGVAHVLYEGDEILLSNYVDYFGCESRNGMIFIVYPNRNMKRNAINLLGASNENPEYIISRVKACVYNYGNQVMRKNFDTWDGIQNEKLYIQNHSLLSDQKVLEEENEDLMNVFEEQLSKTEAINKELSNDVQRLMVENQALRMRLASKDQKPLLYMGEETEFYEGEIREIILEILEDFKRNLKPGTRRGHVVNDILENNDYRQTQAKRREQIKGALKGYKTLNGSLRNMLESLGFVITDDGKHYKWTYFGDHRYVTTAAKTSSDSRAGMNLASTIDNLML